MQHLILILAIGLLWTTLVILLALKLTIAPALSWWLVLAPIYGYPLALVTIFALVFVGGFIWFACGGRKSASE